MKVEVEESRSPDKNRKAHDRLYRFSRHRLVAFKNQIDSLEHMEFPYEDSRLALRKLKGKFNKLIETLDTIASLSNGATEEDVDLDPLKEFSNKTLGILTKHLPVLGFILRSTNVRNGFELVGPLKRIAVQLLSKYRKRGEIEEDLVL